MYEEQSIIQANEFAIADGCPIEELISKHHPHSYKERRKKRKEKKVKQFYESNKIKPRDNSNLINNEAVLYEESISVKGV